ncbi:hypothetical protein OG241_00240 [Streptomyces sp. NBC_01390]|uniref:hypothetical protein n=1 Tax=Streptomyces sp. NBC_01390 TaxID=2903850 RepID=UPI00324B2ED1
MTDRDGARPLLLELDAVVARELVEAGDAVYYLADERGVTEDLVQVAIGGVGNVLAVVVVEAAKPALKAVAQAVRRRAGVQQAGPATVQVGQGQAPAAPGPRVTGEVSQEQSCCLESQEPLEHHLWLTPTD